MDIHIEPGQPWEVKLFKPADASGVAALFKSVYGEGYPVKVYLDPKQLTAENRAGRIISSVAKTPRGDIVGHNALFHSAPCRKIYETGAGLVHRDYRGGHGIFTRMVAHGIEVGARQFGVELVYGEPVCNHPFSQRLCQGQHLITRALEVDLMPAAAYSKEKSATGRVSTLLDFKTLIPRSCTVYVPRAYAHTFPFFYEKMDDTRRFILSTRPMEPARTRDLACEMFDFAQVARLAIKTPGKDLDQVMADQETQLYDQGVAVIYVWLSTGVPWVGAAVDILRDRGYFLGGVLPRWFDDDGLVMTRLTTPPDWDGIMLHFERARKLARLVQADQERTQ